MTHRLSCFKTVDFDCTKVHEDVKIIIRYTYSRDIKKYISHCIICDHMLDCPVSKKQKGLISFDWEACMFSKVYPEHMIL